MLRRNIKIASNDLEATSVYTWHPGAARRPASECAQLMPCSFTERRQFAGELIDNTHTAKYRENNVIDGTNGALYTLQIRTVSDSIVGL